MGPGLTQRKNSLSYSSASHLNCHPIDFAETIPVALGLFTEIQFCFLFENLERASERNVSEA